MCMSPIQIHYNMVEHKYQYNYDGKTCDIRRSIPVACGKCPECTKKWKSQLAQRARIEIERYGYSRCCFLTLTVNDESIDEIFPNRSLKHEYFQKFMKRLRAKLEYHGFKGKIKYLCCGEYGHLNGRPHFHAIIFGWKPDDLKTFGKRSKKGYLTWNSNFLNECWRKVGATQKEIDEFNKKYGTNFDYLPLGMLTVGDISMHTAPYMAKYITKFKEIKGDEFVVNGRNVRKPYLIYPKKILGSDYFIAHYKEILARGYILTSNGKRFGIPKNWLKICEKDEYSYMLPAYEAYQERMKNYIDQKNLEIMRQHGLTSKIDLYYFLVEDGRRRRMIYDIFKNIHR